MDELLYAYDEPEEGELPPEQISNTAVPVWRRRVYRAMSAAADQFGRVRHRASALFHRADTRRNVPACFGPVTFFVASAIIGAALVLTTVYTPSYTVLVDGVAVGAVRERTVYEAVVQRVEERASNILGYAYTLDHTIDYQFAFTEKDAITSVSQIETYLFDQVGEVMKTYVLKVNGQFVGASAEEKPLITLLETIKAPYTNGNTASAAFLEDVSITREYTPSNVEQDIARMTEILTANTNGETQYEVQRGDTFMQIAFDNGMDMAELQALNPEQDVNKLYIGQILTVRETIPFLSVKTTETQVYAQAVPSPVEEVADNSMYQGDSRVVTPGVEGQSQITADVTFINGVERGRDIVETLVLSAPTAKVIAVGTKERPSWLPTGQFIWPASGSITSSFGYRYIFGSYSYHSGIDIAVPYGSNVKAADGGTVVWSGTGTGSNWSYGKYVIIDHGNGKQTYYAHNSSLVVNVGDHVYQGQVIAKAGSTGRSTGSHCHFQVKVNGVTVNPLSYLP